jgi:hypothetical protein
MKDLLVHEKLSTEDWKNIVFAIDRDSCVMVLGPGIAIDSQKNRLHDKICQQIATHIGYPIIDNSENFLNLSDKLYQQDGGYRQLLDFIQDTFRSAIHGDIHNILAQLPLSLYLSFSPDTLLLSAFKDLGYDPQFQFFHFKSVENESVKKKKVSTTLVNPTSDYPIIYNLFGSTGSVVDEDSLILTHDHLFDFLFSLLGNFPLPEVILNTIREAKSFIFLGFDIDSWYLKLVLRKFKLHEKKQLPSYALFWQSFDNNNGAVQFYNEKFNLTFVNNTVNDIEVFLDELLVQCKNKGINVRKKITASTPDQFNQEILELIGKAETKLVFEKLEASYKGKNKQLGNLMILKAQFSEIMKNSANGTINTEDFMISINSIHARLIEFIESN